MNGPPDWTTCVQNLSASTSTARKARATSRVRERGGASHTRRMPSCTQEGAKQALSQLDADRLGQLDAAARRRAGAERGASRAATPAGPRLLPGSRALRALR